MTRVIAKNPNLQGPVLVVLSGGQDSTTCLYWALKTFDHVHAVTFNYGQRHDREIDCAIEIANRANVDGRHVLTHEVIGLGDHILKSTSPLVKGGGELEQYENHQSLPGGIEKTFVPLRNQLFLTIAANRAIALGCKVIVTGVCEEDFGGYPDCRQVFVESFQETTNLAVEGDAEPLTVATPLMRLDKANTVTWSTTLPGCYGMLAYTHTSYDGNYPPIGRDHATLLRAKGFELADIPDPLVLRAIGEGLMQVPPTQNYRGENVVRWSAVMMEDLHKQPRRYGFQD